jgi:hypothetical protein
VSGTACTFPRQIGDGETERRHDDQIGPLAEDEAVEHGMGSGPAVWVALSALSSQPEPMIEPSETNISPQKPTVRCSPGLASAAPVDAIAMVVLLVTRPRAEAPDRTDGARRAVHQHITFSRADSKAGNAAALIACLRDNLLAEGRPP